MKWIEVDIAGQQLRLHSGGSVQQEWSVSTAKNGPGERNGSGCTPRGRHLIRAKIGEGQPEGTVFVGRRPTGEVCDQALFKAQPERDWILSRILWLSGLEPGRNRLGNVDTMRRFIYIHGCPEAFPMGLPLSAGCIRMRNHAVIELFNLVPVGTEVQIRE